MNANTGTALSERIESKIDKEITGGLAIAAGGQAVTIAPKSMGEVMEFAKMMSLAGAAIRPAFRNQPGACLAITLQAMRWGMDPIACCNKAYIVNDQLAYEAQLVHAVVNTRAPLQERLKASFSGEGQGRRCHIAGLLAGEHEPATYDSPDFGAIKPKNSPLWITDPDQQLRYYSIRAWARAHVPEVLLGVYTDDEIASGPSRAKDVTPPRPTRAMFTPPQDDEPEIIDNDMPTERANGGADELPPTTVAKSAPAVPPVPFTLSDSQGVVIAETADWQLWIKGFRTEMSKAGSTASLEAVFEGNSPQLNRVPEVQAAEIRADYQQFEANLVAAKKGGGKAPAAKLV